QADKPVDQLLLDGGNVQGDSGDLLDQDWNHGERRQEESQDQNQVNKENRADSRPPCSRLDKVDNGVQDVGEQERQRQRGQELPEQAQEDQSQPDQGQGHPLLHSGGPRSRHDSLTLS